MDRFAALRVFTMVVDEGGFAAAARRLNLSRAMAAKRVQALEDALGARLLTRTTRKVSLTEVGQRYYERIGLMLSELDAADAEAREAAATLTGALRITAPVTFGVRYIAPILPDFLMANPGVSVDVAYADRYVDLIEDGFDLAIRIGQLEDSSLIARKLASCAMACAASPDYLARRGTPQDPQDLSAHDCLVYAYAPVSDIWRFERDGERRSVRVRGRMRANNGEALVLAAAAGAGVYMCPDFIICDALRDGQLTPVLSDWAATPRDVYAVYPGGRRPPLKTRAFVDFLARAFAGDPPWRTDVPGVIS